MTSQPLIMSKKLTRQGTRNIYLTFCAWPFQWSLFLAWKLFFSFLLVYIGICASYFAFNFINYLCKHVHNIVWYELASIEKILWIKKILLNDIYHNVEFLIHLSWLSYYYYYDVNGCALYWNFCIYVETLNKYSVTQRTK